MVVTSLASVPHGHLALLAPRNWEWRVLKGPALSWVQRSGNRQGRVAGWETHLQLLLLGCFQEQIWAEGLHSIGTLHSENLLWWARIIQLQERMQHGAAVRFQTGSPTPMGPVRVWQQSAEGCRMSRQDKGSHTSYTQKASPQIKATNPMKLNSDTTAFSGLPLTNI